jgi:predicted PurR-regulated permease PerM
MIYEPETPPTPGRRSPARAAHEKKGTPVMSEPLMPPRQRSDEVVAVETPGSRELLFVAVAVVVVAGLYLGREVLIPITLAMLLSFLLAPLVNLLRRLYLGRVLSVLASVLLALMVILALGGLIGTQLATLAEEVPKYAQTIQQKIDTLQQLMASRITDLTLTLGHKPVPAPVKTGAAVRGTPSADSEKPVQVEVHQPDLTAIELARRIVTPVVEPLSTTAIVLIVSIFILLQREDLRDRMIRLFGTSDLHRTTLAMNDAARRLSHYLLTQLAVNTSFGVIIGIGLAVIGVPSPVMWGILGALLRFVPYVGAPLSALMPLTLAAAIDPGWSLLLWTAALYVAVEVTLGQAVEPMLYGHSTGLSPFAVVVAATFWTWLWGPIGLILSTPMTLCLVVLGRHVAHLEFLEVLLGNRPPLTPVQSFYQRILAGDPDEAHDQAEVLLKEMSLSSYYDQVVLNGLRLAIVDAERGVLTPIHLARIKVSINGLIDDLDDQLSPAGSEEIGPEPSISADPAADGPVPDGAPGTPETPASGHKPLVLCIAGRGSLDEEASAMLAQLLREQGLESRVVRHAAINRGAIGTLDVSGVVMVCVSYVTMTGNPSHLRYLMRRLHVRLPRDVPVLVGFWPEDEAILNDDRLRAAVGADYYTSSLHEAVAQCLEVAREVSIDKATRDNK